MPHDFAAQKAETFATYRELSEGSALPDTADVDYFFAPDGGDADCWRLADALSRKGFACEFAEDEDGSWLSATLPDQAISAASIWNGEEIATRIALDHGFAPDGWGFEAWRSATCRCKTATPAQNCRTGQIGLFCARKACNAFIAEHTFESPRNDRPVCQVQPAGRR